MNRTERRHAIAADDQRDTFQRDRDRILYSSAFRRLSGITQVVRAGEADVFHTRQQHTLKVAQVGRRLAELLRGRQRDECVILGVEPEVVEAAALAHDLGHPPFGHVGETTLNKLVLDHDDDDGYEGNAQTFRIVTKLAVRFAECAGLDLCRATLAACIKYPWFRDANDVSRKKKWGAYRVDSLDFEFACGLLTPAVKSTEAELMDWADDIAYSVHDLEDAHRCGTIPWRKIFFGDYKENLVKGAVEAWFAAPPEAAGRLRKAFDRLKSFFHPDIFKVLIDESYEGTREQRLQLRTMTSQLIGRYIAAVTLRVPEINDSDLSTMIIGEDQLDEVKILKQITRDFIINSPTLIAQQLGQARIISTLFQTIHGEDQMDAPPRFLPRRLEYLWSEDISRARFAADCVSSLTEAEAVGLWRRLEGHAGGSVLDPIVR